MRTALFLPTSCKHNFIFRRRGHFAQSVQHAEVQRQEKEQENIDPLPSSSVSLRNAQLFTRNKVKAAGIHVVLHCYISTIRCAQLILRDFCDIQQTRVSSRSPRKQADCKILPKILPNSAHKAFCDCSEFNFSSILTMCVNPNWESSLFV